MGRGGEWTGRSTRNRPAALSITGKYEGSATMRSSPAQRGIRNLCYVLRVAAGATPVPMRLFP